MHRISVFFFVAVAAIFPSGYAYALTENELQCGSLQNAFGPFDYRTTPQDKRQLVEGAHFTPEVEQLIRGHTGTSPTGDLDYTLRAFPNHPRALRSLMEWGFRKKTDRPIGTKWPIWCYFDRAVRFQPNDAQVKMVYAIYLQRKGKLKEAIEQLQEAQALAESNANLHYNLGLIYLDIGDHEKSLVHAHRAYKLGFQLEGLRNRLKRANKWRDPEPDTTNPGREEVVVPSAESTSPSPQQATEKPE